MGKKKNKFRPSIVDDIDYKREIEQKMYTPRNLASRLPIVEINPKNPKQYEQIEKIDRSKVTFALGETGSGKTYIAALKALEALQSGRVKKIIIIRPYIEAGEDKTIGLLKGSLLDKMYPYSRSVLDPIIDAVGDRQIVMQMIEAGTIELLPLVFARGLNLDNAFVLFDEVQNATLSGLELVMTRVGKNTKLVVMGDDDQIDLADKSKSCVKLIPIIFNDLFETDPFNFSHVHFDSYENNVRSEVSRKSATVISRYLDKQPKLKQIQRGE